MTQECDPAESASDGLILNGTDQFQTCGKVSPFFIALANTLPDSKRKRQKRNMLHLIWYILVGLIAGAIAKTVMHVHMTIFWTIVLGIIGSIIGGAVTHMFSRPANERYHPAGLIFSTLGAILVLFLCYKLKIRFPHV
jgi:uncharacterized membrane protein YeaQ/YmgE (transglycosylase-associated protein family)